MTKKNETLEKTHTVTVNSDLQIIFSPEICQDLGLTPGQKLQIKRKGEKLELVPSSDRAFFLAKMRQLREEIVAEGTVLLNQEEIDREIEQQRRIY
jgi:bifunctional DNA-binding transcriptional regulator/antitoxin component of YhaV-PrlF toxin-antitoxin module